MKLYVGNLSKTVTDAELNALAIPYGKLLSAVVAIEHGSGASKGFGFIEYASAQEAENAMAGLDGREVDGKSLRVNEAKSRRNDIPSQ
ncbi:MAG TPA: RNA-binding protein [Candidatus Binatia bacterium]|nr:RNA-binding protein [Candidatus Binatia bacterium]